MSIKPQEQMYFPDKYVAISVFLHIFIMLLEIYKYFTCVAPHETHRKFTNKRLEGGTSGINPFSSSILQYLFDLSTRHGQCHVKTRRK